MEVGKKYKGKYSKSQREYECIRVLPDGRFALMFQYADKTWGTTSIGAHEIDEYSEIPDKVKVKGWLVIWNDGDIHVKTGETAPEYARSFPGRSDHWPVAIMPFDLEGDRLHPDKV